MQELLEKYFNSRLLFETVQPALDLIGQNKEYFVALIGLVVALWALRLQRREIAKSGKISALIHASKMLQEKIDFHSQIMSDIEDDGDKRAIWRGHANRINDELRPLKNRIDIEFINIAAKYDGILHEQEIRQALSPKRKDALESG